MNQEVFSILRDQPFFSACEDSEIEKIAELGEFVSIPMGKSVFEKGQEGDAAYVVFSGKVRVLQTGSNGKAITLATLSRGEIFGEQAIIKSEPRSSTIRAADDTVLIRFDQTMFRSLFESYSELQSYFDKLSEHRALINFLRLDTIFKNLPPKYVAPFLDRMDKLSFPEGEVIFEEGDDASEMYIIVKGEVRATRKHNGSNEVLNFIGEGEIFGERALFLEESRFATITPISEVTVLKIDRTTFNEIIDKSPQIKEDLSNKIKEYDHESETDRRHSLKQNLETPSRSVLSYSPASDVSEATPEEVDQVPHPKKRWYKKYPWYRQYDETDCGAASLAMISKYFGVRLSITRLRDLANVGREGASMYSLAAAAEAIGFTTRAVRTDYDHLINIELPVIAHWAGYHYIVIYEVNDKYVISGDPAIGLIRIPRAEFEEKWTGRLLVTTPTIRLLEEEEVTNSIGRFVALLKPHHWLLFEVCIASLILNVFAIASPVFTQTIIDKVLIHQDAQMLNLMLGGMIIVGVFATLTTLLRYQLLIHLSQKLSVRMSSDLFRQIVKLPIKYFQMRKVGDILTRFGDNTKVRDLITSDAINTLLDAFMVLLYLALMFFYNVELTLVALVFIPVSVILTLIITPLIKRNNQRLFEKIAASESKLIETIRNISALKASTAELPTRWKYEDLIVQNANQAWISARLGMILHASSSAMQLFSSVAVLWYGATLVMAGEMTVGQLVAFQVLVGMVMAPVLGLINMWQTLQDAMLSLQRLGDIYDAEPEESDSGTVFAELANVAGNIKMENLSFRYSVDDKNIISNINLEIYPGETIALIGRSGSGKTTLVSLVQRFHEPTEGRILLDGVDIAGISVKSLRANLGIVMQENLLFSGTIRENISLGYPDASMDQVVTAAKLANAHDFITTFPLGYDTLVGEMGIQLSGGQRQRVGIARALLPDPKIIIFDEATSALDTESEKAIQTNMDAILGNRTSIVIAHRLSTIRGADRIAVLDEGEVVEMGSHAELMERRGLYFYLVSQQVGT